MDRSITPVNGKIIIAALDGTLLVKRLVQRDTETYSLQSDDSIMPISKDSDFYIWGVVTHVIHAV